MTVKKFKLIALFVAMMGLFGTAPAAMASGGGSTRKMTRPQGPARTMIGTYEVPGIEGSLPPISASTDASHYTEVPEDFDNLIVSVFSDSRSGKSAGDKDKKRMELRVWSHTLGEKILVLQNKDTEKGKGENLRWSNRMSCELRRSMFPLGEVVEIRVNSDNDLNTAALYIRRIKGTYVETQINRARAAQGLPPLVRQSALMGVPQPLPQQSAFPAYVGGAAATGERGNPRMPQSGVPGFPVLQPEQQAERPQDEPFKAEPVKLRRRTNRSSTEAQPSGSPRNAASTVAPAPAGDDFRPGEGEDESDTGEGMQSAPASQPRRQQPVSRQTTRTPSAPRERSEELDVPKAPSAPLRRNPQTPRAVTPRRQGPPTIDLTIDLNRSESVNAVAYDLTVFLYVEGKFVKRVTIGAEESRYTTEVPAGELSVRLGSADAENWIVGKKSAALTLPGNTWRVTLKELVSE